MSANFSGEHPSSPAALPEYFITDPTAPGVAGVEQAPGIPANIIDVFYLQDRPGNTAELIGVLSCSGGTIDTVTSTDLSSQPDFIQNQFKALQVANRGNFRAVTADRVALLSVTGVYQSMAVSGLNDPVELTGKLTMTGNEPNPRAGKLMAGRLDVLDAYRRSVEYAFRSPDPTRTDDHVFPLLLAGGSAQSRSGAPELVIAYPMLDPTIFESQYNSYFTLSMVYDLLLQLKRDMAEEKTGSRLENMIIPAPDRSRLEQELIEDGYRIEGDEAYRVAGSGNSGSKGILGRMRSLAAEWSAERIKLPPEATHADYARIVNGVLNELYGADDRQASAILQRAVTARLQTGAPSTVPRTQPALPVHHPRPATHHIPTTPTMPSPPTPPPAPPQAPPDFSEDFLVRPISALRGNEPQPSFPGDFDVMQHLGVRTESRVQPAPLANDFGRQAIKAVAEPPATRAADYASDFGAASGPAPIPKEIPRKKEPTSTAGNDFDEPNDFDDFKQPPKRPKASRQQSWDNDF